MATPSITDDIVIKTPKSVDSIEKVASEQPLSYQTKDVMKDLLASLDEAIDDIEQERVWTQALLQVKDSRALKVLNSLIVAGFLIKKGKLRGSYYIFNDEV